MFIAWWYAFHVSTKPNFLLHSWQIIIILMLIFWSLLTFLFLCLYKTQRKNSSWRNIASSWAFHPCCMTMIKFRENSEISLNYSLFSQIPMVKASLNNLNNYMFNSLPSSWFFISISRNDMFSSSYVSLFLGLTMGNKVNLKMRMGN